MIQRNRTITLEYIHIVMRINGQNPSANLFLEREGTTTQDNTTSTHKKTGLFLLFSGVLFFWSIIFSSNCMQINTTGIKHEKFNT